MDELISIIVLILYFVAMGAAGKNKKKKKAKQQAASKRSVQFEQAFERMMTAQRTKQEHGAHKPEKPTSEQLRMEPSQEGEDPCHSDMLRRERPTMRVEAVTQAQMHAAAEGDDPCHSGGASETCGSFEDSPIEHSPIFNTEDKDAFAQDILRGVIMSEVLTRPAQRRWGAGMKRGA